jgi:putative hydrolases of HD superfamily
MTDQEELVADPTAFLRFWSLALRLKQVRRQGWIDRGVADPESSADHSWGVALLAWLLARDRSDLKSQRVLLLALLHDLPEALAGDVTPFDELRDAEGNITPNQFRAVPAYSDVAQRVKHAAELAALETLMAELSPATAAEVRALWLEYEAAETPEARFVRQIDKLETLLQAEDYLSREPHLIIDSFRLGTARDVTDPGLVHLLAALRPPATPEPEN